MLHSVSLFGNSRSIHQHQVPIDLQLQTHLARAVARVHPICRHEVALAY